MAGEGFHWIAPSRFGYLRSTFREGATFDDEAHAYAALLDHAVTGFAAVVAQISRLGLRFPVGGGKELC